MRAAARAAHVCGMPFVVNGCPCLLPLILSDRPPARSPLTLPPQSQALPVGMGAIDVRPASTLEPRPYLDRPEFSNCTVPVRCCCRCRCTLPLPALPQPVLRRARLGPAASPPIRGFAVLWMQVVYYSHHIVNFAHSCVFQPPCLSLCTLLCYAVCLPCHLGCCWG